MFEQETTWIEISESALAHNLQTIRNLVGKDCRITPCIKSNAYGHGLLQVGLTLDRLGVDGSVVFSFAEAVTLQDGGCTKPILVIGPVHVDHFEELVKREIRLFVHDLETAKLLSQIAQKPAYVHVKVDTGMGRFGVLPEDSEAFCLALAKLPNLVIEGIATHFATADGDEGGVYLSSQLGRFKFVLETLKKQGIDPQYCHAANSGATIRYPETHFNTVRPGRITYGFFDTRTGAPDLRQVLTLKTRITQVKVLRAGETISYDQTYTATVDMKVAVVPVGYFDGISTHLSNRGSFLVDGTRCKIVGKVCMNATMIDVSGIPHVQQGDEVVCIGGQGGEEISFYDLAEAASLPYPLSLLTGIREGIPRFVVA